MTMKFAFFPGCLIPTKYPQMEAAVRKTLPNLGIEVVDLAGFTCCPEPIYFKATDKIGWLTMAARNLCIAEEAGLDVFTICSGCTATLSETWHILHDRPDCKNEVNKRLARIGKEYKGTSRIRHIVTILRDEIGLPRVAQSVKKPLSGVTVAIHYGCHFLKPSRIMNVDNPDHPHILDDLISAIGATPVKHKERVLCCGRSCQTEETRTSMASTVITSVSDSRADLMGMICPTCFTEFDLGQLKLSKKLNLDRPTPPSYLFQLLGIAQGFTPEEMGLGMQKLKPEKLVGKA